MAWDRKILSLMIDREFDEDFDEDFNDQSTLASSTIENMRLVQNHESKFHVLCHSENERLIPSSLS